MAITYTWKVTKIQSADIGNSRTAVTRVEWEKTGEEDGLTATFNGVTTLPPAELDENFIPFKKVKEKDVLQWVKEKMDPNMHHHVDTQIKLMLDRQRVVSKDTKLPWEK
jgi:hypothetical protein